VLLLGRDRLGKKPLYYRSQLDTDGFYFCSLQKPLRELGKNTIDELGIVSYLHLGYILDPLTIYKEIKSIRPYEIVRKSQNEIESSILTYRPKKPKDSSRQIRELVTESITSRVGDHGEVALCLSGGVDSSVIALVLAQEGIKTSAYSVCWKDSDKERYNSDFEQAKKTAKYLGLDFRPVEALRVDEVPDTLDHFLKIMEEPSNNPTGLSMISLYRRISEDGLRLALTGDGADEIFGGYMRYRYISRLGLLSRVFNAKLFRHVDISDWKSWVHWHECFSLEEIDSDFAINSSTIEKSLSVFDRVFQEAISRHAPNNLKKMMALDQSIWLSMESNRRLDRISMEYSIEARSPFQDDNLYEWWLNRGEFGISASLNKRELWRAFPELKELGISKQKKGFISPLGHWIRNNLEWINANLNWLAQQGLITRKSPWELSQIANGGNLKSLQKIWTVLVLSRWLQNFSVIENDEL
jgi:asparagine synthase (glutamine-hydrolysing)